MREENPRSETHADPVLRPSPYSAASGDIVHASPPPSNRELTRAAGSSCNPITLPPWKPSPLQDLPPPFTNLGFSNTRKRAQIRSPTMMTFEEARTHLHPQEPETAKNHRLRHDCAEPSTASNRRHHLVCALAC